MFKCSSCKKEINKYGRCSDCNKIYMAEYRKNNLEKVKKGQKDHYRRNSEKVKIKVKEYRNSIPDIIKKRKSEYYENNSDKIKRKVKKYANENKEKIKKHHAEYHVKNREKIIFKVKEWRKNNPEKRLSTQREYRKNNREKINAGIRNWLLINKEKYQPIKNTHTRNYVAKKKNSKGKHSLEEIRNLYDNQNGICNVCEISILDGYEVDHIYPISKGGNNTIDNLQLLCRFCNRSKGNRTMEEWLILRESGKL